MLNSASLLVPVFLAVSSFAAPVPQVKVSLPVSVRFNLTDGKLPDIDRARAARLFEIGRAKEHQVSGAVDGALDDVFNAKRAATASSLAVTNDAVSYVANVGVGNPATQYSLLIDTGSSNTWVGAGKKYVQTSSSTNTGHSVVVNYGSGSFSGTEYTDTVSLGPGLVIDKQSIGVASTSQGFEGVDGILGVGPVDLTENTVSGVSRVQTVSDNLYLHGKIPTEVLAMSFNPATSQSSANGELTFGGLDSSKYNGSITYTPITKTEPSSFYWGIDQSVVYGTSQSVLSGNSGIVDTGTTLILIATDAFNRYQAATGATLDSNTGLLSITKDQYSRLQSLFFTIGGTRFELTPNAQIWPRALNSYIGGTRDGIYLVVADIGMNSGSGMDFINGYTFLERFYAVYDTSSKRVGLATTANTKATTN
ncbi:family A1 protease [Schizopora paradoxa]|uniref:Family A1 protease n=1 Tax=Schizopora paradoxa TaxID=27342 RepID=A0A0H2RYS5_9AGAM|nr:family A1 protease [Schizopora paradoxa]